MGATVTRKLSRALDRNDDALARMKLALDPRFASTVITFDADLAPQVFAVCAAPQCLRIRRSHTMCFAHLDRWTRRGQPPLEEFLAAPDQPTDSEQIQLDGLPEQVRIEVALVMQLATTTGNYRLDPQYARRLVKLLGQHQAATLLKTFPPGLQSELEVLSESRRHLRGALRTVLGLLEDFLHPADPNQEFERDTWRLSVMGLPGLPTECSASTRSRSRGCAGRSSGSCGGASRPRRATTRSTATAPPCNDSPTRSPRRPGPTLSPASSPGPRSRPT
jgi:hypothetical protein